MEIIKLLRSNSKYTHAVLIGTILSIYFLAWQIKVNSVPSVEDFSSFFYPFLNYLYASIVFDPEYSFLSRVVITDNSPLGLLIPAAIISTLNMQLLFIKAHYLVVIPLLFALCSTTLFFNFDPKTRWIFIAIIFFFPPIQILLKADYTNSSSVVFSLLSVLFMRSYINNNKLAHLLGFSICTWYSVITGISGLLFSINILIATYASLIKDHQKIIKVSMAILIIALLSSPFYYAENLTFFINGLLIPDHLPKTLSKVLILLIPNLLLLSSYLSANNTRTLDCPKFFKDFLLLFCFLILSIYLICKDPQSSTGGWITLITFVLGYITITFIDFKYKFEKICKFEFLVTIVCMMNCLILYEFSNQKILAFLTFSLLLVCIQSLLQTRSNSRKLCFLLVCFCCSNFFPTSSQLQNWLEGNGMRLSVNLVKNLHFNSLGWQKSEMKITQLELETILSRYNFSNEKSLCAFDNLHFNSRLLLSIPVNFSSSIPSLKRLDELSQEDLNKFLITYGQRKQELFEDWLSKKRFSYLIEGVKPWEIDHQPSAPLAELQNNPNRKGEIGMSLSRSFVKYLHNSGKIEKYYEKYEIPQNDPRINLYVNRSMPKVKDQPKRMNLELSRLGIHLPIDLYRKNPPDWFQKIHPKIQKQIRSREAIKIHTLGKKFLDQANYFEAYKRLRIAFEINPTNSTIKTDYEAIQSQLPNSFDKFLEN